MSSTILYRLGRDPGDIGAARNAWLGAFHVWDYIAKRYCKYANGFPMLSDDRFTVWNAYKTHSLAEHEKIVLLTTLDKAIVYGRDKEKLIAAFDKYANEHPNSNFGQQADVIRKADLQPDDMIAWQQTSVGEFWGETLVDDEAHWYDPAKGDHFDVMEIAANPGKELP